MYASHYCWERNHFEVVTPSSTYSLKKNSQSKNGRTSPDEWRHYAEHAYSINAANQTTLDISKIQTVELDHNEKVRDVVMFVDFQVQLPASDQTSDTCTLGSKNIHEQLHVSVHLRIGHVDSRFYWRQSN